MSYHIAALVEDYLNCSSHADPYELEEKFKKINSAVSQCGNSEIKDKFSPIIRLKNSPCYHGHRSLMSETENEFSFRFTTGFGIEFIIQSLREFLNWLKNIS